MSTADIRTTQSNALVANLPLVKPGPVDQTDLSALPATAAVRCFSPRARTHQNHSTRTFWPRQNPCPCPLYSFRSRVHCHGNGKSLPTLPFAWPELSRPGLL